MDFEILKYGDKKETNGGICLNLRNLDLIYVTGEGMRIIYVEAAKWSRRAAAQGVLQDNRNAFKWFSLAAAYLLETREKTSG